GPTVKFLTAGIAVWIIATPATAAEFTHTPQANSERVFVPAIDGPWWQVAGNPDVGQYTSDQQQPVDFAIWQAADGTWQLWSCIRNTKYPGSCTCAAVSCNTPHWLAQVWLLSRDV